VVVACIVFAYGGSCPQGWDAAMANAAAVSRKDAEFQECLAYERQAFVLGRSCAPIPGVIVRMFDTEEMLIAELRHELIVRKRVDIVVGHNIVGFDISYLAHRVTRDGVASQGSVGRAFMRFGVIAAEALDLQLRAAAKALGPTKVATINGAGIAYIDTMLLCKEAHKLPSNGLDAVAKHFLGQQKHEMPMGLVPEVARGANASHWRKLTAYCVQDCCLPLALLRLWDSVKESVEMARVMITPLAVAVRCGLQQKVRNPLIARARMEQFNMIMNGVNEPHVAGREYDKNESAQGGLVLASKQGLYTTPCAVLDFGSLYPSIMKTLNICWSTVVNPLHITQAHLDNGLKLQTHQTNLGPFTFATNVPGVCPQQLHISGVERNAAKAMMKGQPKSSSVYQNANNKQNQLKKWMNATYGAANAAEGSAIMPCKAVGSVTCGTGRLMNMEANAVIVKTFPGVNVVYGDTDSLMLIFAEPPEVAAACDRVRVQYCRDQALLAQNTVNEHFRAKYGHANMKVELEKIYMPSLFCGKGGDSGKVRYDAGEESVEGAKKAYGGVHLSLDIIDRLPDMLVPANAAAGIVGGFIETKGMRSVRRDVPAFVKGMVNKLLHALFFDRSEDKFFDITHAYVEDIAFGEGELADVDAYVSTAEISYSGNEAHPSAHVAVAYAREYAMPGAAFPEGSRVPFVVVEEPEHRRVIRPPWFVAAEDGSLDRDATSHKHEELLRSGALRDVMASVAASAAAAKDAKSMYARHPDEVRADPDNNHIDIVHYVDRGICTVLKQLMPAAIDEQERIMQFAREVASIRLRRRQEAARAAKSAAGGPCGLSKFMRQAAAAGGGQHGAADSSAFTSQAAAANSAPLRTLVPRLPHKRTAPSRKSKPSAPCLGRFMARKDAPGKADNNAEEEAESGAPRGADEGAEETPGSPVQQQTSEARTEALCNISPMPLQRLKQPSLDELKEQYLQNEARKLALRKAAPAHVQQQVPRAAAQNYQRVGGGGGGFVSHGFAYNKAGGKATDVAAPSKHGVPSLGKFFKAPLRK
jgi:DNA polymerase elongation subunit (family B)